MREQVEMGGVCVWVCVRGVAAARFRRGARESKMGRGDGEARRQGASAAFGVSASEGQVLHARSRPQVPVQRAALVVSQVGARRAACACVYLLVASGSERAMQSGASEKKNGARPSPRILFLFFLFDRPQVCGRRRARHPLPMACLPSM